MSSSGARLWLTAACFAGGCAWFPPDRAPILILVGLVSFLVLGLRRSPARPIALGAAMFVTGGIVTAIAPFGRSPSDVPIGASATMTRAALTRATAVLEPSAGALLRGLTVGDTSAISYEIMEQFRASGLTHLVAVSGTNVAIVAGAALLMLRRAGRRAAAGAALAAITFFAMVVGPEPSVLRAAVMGGIATIGYAGGVRVDPLRGLALALTAVLAARPDMVASLGLQLSVAATAGIVLWARPLQRRLRALPDVVSGPLAVTLAAQGAVTPLLIGAFGRLSVIAPVANLLAVPAIVPATLGGFAAAILGLVSDASARLVARAVAPFVSWILSVAAVFGTPSWASVEVSRSWAVPTGLVAAMAAAWAIRKR